MSEINTILIISFGTLTSLCLCYLITVKCKIPKKINNRVEKIRKRFNSVDIEEINVETNYDDIESNVEEEIKSEEMIYSQQV